MDDDVSLIVANSNQILKLEVIFDANSSYVPLESEIKPRNITSYTLTPPPENAAPGQTSRGSPALFSWLLKPCFLPLRKPLSSLFSALFVLLEAS